MIQLENIDVCKFFAGGAVAVALRSRNGRHCPLVPHCEIAGVGTVQRGATVSFRAFR